MAFTFRSGRALAVIATLAMAVAADARDDVPEELLHAKNEVSLSAKRVVYFAKQFKTKCARCHGALGDGAGTDAEQDVPPADLTDAAAMSQRSDGQLFYQILVGGMPRCAMPAFGPESDHGWSEKKIWEMVAFVRRFSETPDE
ncbi:MAG: cytochrome c [bacterium]|nr:cytochrome c [bacterium]